MKSSIYIITVIISSLYFFSCSQEVTGVNIIKNPSFEEISGNGNIQNWEQNSYFKTDESRQFISSNDAIDGNLSAQIINHQENHSSLIQTLAVAENSKYEIRIFIKTRDVGTDFIGANFTIADMYGIGGDVRGTEDWKEYGLYFETKKDIHSVQVMLSLGYYGAINTGTAWFDKISVKKVSQFTEQYPRVVVEKKEHQAVPIGPVNETAQNRINAALDLFSIFASIILFLGTALYMIFVIQEDKPKEDDQNNPDNENSQTQETTE